MFLALITLLILGQVPPHATPPDTVSTATMATVITSIVSAGVVAILRHSWVQNAEKRGEEKGRQSISATIENQPLMVRMADEFVTRREFEKFEASMGVSLTKLEGMFLQTMQAVQASNASTDKRMENMNKRVGENIEKVAKAAYEGRGKIWNKVNQQGEEMARLTERCDVAEGIQKLGDVIATAITTKGHEQAGN